MTDFHLWSKESLVKFVEEAIPRLLAQEDEIAELKVKLLRAQVAQELAKPVTLDTV